MPPTLKIFAEVNVPEFVTDAFVDSNGSIWLLSGKGSVWCLNTLDRYIPELVTKSSFLSVSGNLVAFVKDETVIVTNTVTQEPIFQTTGTNVKAINLFGHQLAIAHQGKIQVYDLQTSQFCEYAQSAVPSFIRFIRMGSQLVSADYFLDVMHLRENRVVRIDDRDYSTEMPVYDVSSDPNGNVCVCTGAIEILDENGKSIAFRGDLSITRAVLVSDRCILARKGGLQGPVKQIDVEKMKVRREIVYVFIANRSSALAHSVDEGTVAICYGGLINIGRFEWRAG